MAWKQAMAFTLASELIEPDDTRVVFLADRQEPDLDQVAP